MRKEQLKKLPYEAPFCKVIPMQTENFICASVTLDPSASSEPNWDPETYNFGDHDEWFGSMGEVAP